MDVRNRNRALFVVLSASLVVWLVWMLVGDSEKGPGRSQPAVVESTSRDPDLSEEFVERSAERRATRDDGSAPSINTPSLEQVLGRGRVVDDALGSPLAVCVTPDVGPSLFTKASDGAFVLDERHKGCTKLRVDEPGFEVLEFDAAECFTEEVAELRLVGKRRSSVVVEDAYGAAMPGVVVDWRKLARRGVGDGSETAESEEFAAFGATLVVPTDGRGVSETTLGVLAQALVRDPRSSATYSLSVTPGDQRVVTLGSTMRLEFVDFETREPLPGLAFVIWASRDSNALAQRLVTDEAGGAVVGWSTGPLLVRLPGTSTFQRDLHSLTPGGEPSGMGATFKPMLSIPEHVERLVIGVRTCGARVLLRDATTGAPIDAEVRIQNWRSDCTERIAEKPGRCTWSSPRCGALATGDVYRAHRGELTIPCYHYSPDGRAPLAGVDPQLAMLVAGYEPALLVIPAEPPPRGSAPIELELQPAPQRSLSVQYSSGLPYTGPVTVFAPSPDIVLWRRASSRDGLHGPFDWFGGDVDVLGRRISAQELESSELVTLVVPDDTGAIEIVGAPPAASFGAFIARSSPGEPQFEFTPTKRTESGCLFEHVQPGTYLVGPEGWVSASQLHSITPGPAFEDVPTSARAVVRPGETARVAWRPAWRCGEELRGRITWTGEPTPDLVLVPYYSHDAADAPGQAAGMPSFPFGRATARIALDRNGEYCISADDPRPTLIVVALSEPAIWGGSSKVWVIETIRPGESFELQRANVVLEWEGEPAAAAMRVSYDIPASRLRYPLGTFHREGRSVWNTAKPLELRGLPVQVDRIAIEGKMLEFEPLKPGETRKLVVSYGELPKLTRR